MSKKKDMLGKGYGIPPLHTRFKQGQSGNPTGRPKKARPSKAQSSRELPIETMFREEAAKLITVKSGDDRLKISKAQSIICALLQTGAQGGVLAQRTILEFLVILDRQEFERKREQFELWCDYVLVRQSLIDKAVAAGREPPNILPHPDDIELDYDELTVKLTGPMDEEDAVRFEKLRRIRNLVFELMLFYGEDNTHDEDNPANSRVGLLMIWYAAIEASLPRRMRDLSVEERAVAERRMMQPYRRWAAYLKEECDELGIPFKRLPKDLPTWTIAEFGDRLAKVRARA